MSSTTQPLPFKLVFLESNIGSGKSTAIRDIAAMRPNWQFHDEPLGNWCNVNGVNLLNQFYSDPAKYAYQFQLYILDDYKKRLTDLGTDGVHVMARSPRSAINVFTAAAYNAGHLNEVQRTALVDKYKEMYRTLNLKDAKYVYLRVSPETAFYQTTARARPEEQGLIDYGYIQLIHDLHEDEFHGFSDQEVDIIGERAVGRGPWSVGEQSLLVLTALQSVIDKK